MKKKKNKLTSETILFNEIAALIELSKMQVVAQVNSTMTLLFWRVGKRINEFVLNHKRAEYGKQIVVTLSRQLEERYGRNFEEKNLRRKLKRLIAIELKIGRFQAKHKGQMELYLKWLNKHERQPGEDPPVGLILCAETSREQVELLEMHKDGIMVAEYWTELPPRKELEKRLHNAYLEAKEMIDKRKLLE